ncbi:hypothetical protein CASFOL_034895 [Castilleja foliolosa]|uniref:Secreted protein n=1 Tax=Castilleja foliolosa TaxID=1961234 RepID=A0ABD3BRZ1_9LAMI
MAGLKMFPLFIIVLFVLSQRSIVYLLRGSHCLAASITTSVDVFPEKMTKSVMKCAKIIVKEAFAKFSITNLQIIIVIAIVGRDLIKILQKSHFDFG